MALEAWQANIVFKTLQLNQHSQRQLIHIADSKHVYVGSKIQSPGKWVAYFISQIPDSYGSRIIEIEYSVNSIPYTCMGQSNQQRAVEFYTAELDDVAEENPSANLLPIHFAFALRDKLLPRYLRGSIVNHGFQLQRLDNRLTMDLWAAAVNRQHTDIEVVVGKTTYHAHRAILAARSAELASRIGNGRRIEITDVPPATFEALLKFIYTGVIHGPVDIVELFYAAYNFKVETLSRLGASSLSDD
jgi:BTB/POZ domain